MNLAQEAYEAYANHTNWKSLATGQPLPQWDALPQAIRDAWQVSAAWVAGKVSGQHDWQIPSIDTAFALRIESDAMTGDNEGDHIMADAIVEELLAKLGCNKTLEAYGKVGKWYA